MADDVTLEGAARPKINTDFLLLDEAQTPTP